MPNYSRLKFMVMTLSLGAFLSSCTAIEQYPGKSVVEKMKAEGASLLQSGSSDRELEVFKSTYLSMLETAESTDYRVESDMKMGLMRVMLYPGVYTSVKYDGGADNEPGIVAIEKFTLSDQSRFDYMLTIYRKGGQAFEWSASGDYSIVGQVLFIKNPRGDSRVLPYDVAIKRFSRCIITENNHNHVKLGCDSKRYLGGGEFFSYRPLGEAPY